MSELVAATRRRGSVDVRQMVRIAQMYYRLRLSQEQIGRQLGLSRFQVGRLLDRALREDIVRIDIVHPEARLLDLEDALVTRFGLRAAVVADAPVTADARDDDARDDDDTPSTATTPSTASERAAQALAREAVAGAAVRFLADLRPTGSIGVSWGRTMLELSHQLMPGWTHATEVVQLNGATSRSSEPTRANEIAERFATTTDAAIRLLAAPAIVGSPELRVALEGDPAIGGTIDAARSTTTAIFSLGLLTLDSVLVGSGYLSESDVGNLRAAGAVGDVLGRFLRGDGQIASRQLNERTVGLPLTELVDKPASVGLAAGAGRGPIALAAVRGGFVNVLVADAHTAQWVLDHG